MILKAIFAFWLLAEHPGDAQYKSIVHQAFLKLPAFNEGAEQRITFDRIPDQSFTASSRRAKEADRANRIAAPSPPPHVGGYMDNRSEPSPGTKSLKVYTTSDSGRPVYFYVREGPAEVDGDSLRFTKIPPRATFPIRVTVVAWQLGCAGERKLKTAEPVEREFLLTK